MCCKYYVQFYFKKKQKAIVQQRVIIQNVDNDIQWQCCDGKSQTIIDYERLNLDDGYVNKIEIGATRGNNE